MLRSRRTWVTIAVIDALPALVAVLLAITDVGPRPGTGPGVPLRGAHRRHALPARRDRDHPAAVPARPRWRSPPGDAIAGEAQQGTLRYVLIRPVGRTRLLVAKLVAVMGFVLLTLLVVAATAYVLGVAAARRPRAADRRPRRSPGTSLTTPQLARRTGLALAYALLSMLGRRRGRAVPVDDRPLAARRGDGHAGAADRVVAAAHARRGARAAALPRHPLLAVVRRPLPRSDPVARRRPRGGPAGGLRRGVPAAPPGPTS